ncbi:MAG: hypothetical protein J0L60_04475 [Ignavibacteria bacterium]|nr:hypothetical protein [Ignavibacteria bacterium]
MKSILKKYGFAVMSVSVIAGYFLFTGGVMNTAVVVPPPTITNLTSAVTLNVGRGVVLSFRVIDNAPGDVHTTTVCDPPNLTPVDVTTPLPVPDVEIEHSTKLNSPGSVATEWSKQLGIGGGGNYFINKSFNAPGVYTVTVRARIKRNAGYSEYDTKTMTVTVTGTAPLPLKRYTFMRLLAEYRDASGGTISATQVIFTDPANQYFELKGDDKIDMVFKWKPTAADIQAVPDFETNYDIRDLNKTYQVLNKALSGTTPFWSYKIKYDETRVVEFEFIEDALNGNLYATKPAKAGNGTTIRLIFQFRK